MFDKLGSFISPTNILMAGKTILQYNKSKKGINSAKNIGAINARREKDFYEFNKKNLQDAYDMTFQSYMSSYVDERMDLADQYSNAQSNLNIIASQMGYSLTDSSYENDIQDQLDREYSNELQDSYTNITRKLTQLMFDKSIKEVSLKTDLNNKLGSINSTVDSLKQQSNDLFYNNLTDLGIKLYDDYRALDSKDKLKSLNTKTVDKFWSNQDIDELLNFRLK